MPGSRYNFTMTRSAAKLLEAADRLSSAERFWLIDSLMEKQGSLSDEAIAGWQKAAGEAEAGYEEWFRHGVEAALADDSGDVPHEQAMQSFHAALRQARSSTATAKLKETA